MWGLEVLLSNYGAIMPHFDLFISHSPIDKI